jgi:hypothetical protein
MLLPTGPGSSDYHFKPSPSIDENINSLIQMLNGSPLSYEKETCQRLFQSITKKLPQAYPQLKHLSEIIENPLAFDTATIQEAIQQLREINK